MSNKGLYPTLHCGDLGGAEVLTEVWYSGVPRVFLESRIGYGVCGVSGVPGVLGRPCVPKTPLKSRDGQYTRCLGSFGFRLGPLKRGSCPTVTEV